MNTGSKVLAGVTGGVVGFLLFTALLIAYVISLPLSFFEDGDYDDLWNFRQEYYDSINPGGYGGAAIVEIAEREWQEYGGTACGYRYWPSPGNWCVDFVYWCGNECGYVGDGEIFGPTARNVSAEFDHMMDAGAQIYYPGDGTIPQPGDIIAFWDDIGRPGRASDGVPLYQNLLCHTGIVTEGTDTTVTIIEGNAGGGGYTNSTIKKNTYSLTGCSWGNTYICCFARPQYPYTGLAGSGDYWFSSHNPGRVQMLVDEDPSYGGHPVSVTDEEMRAIVYTIYREMGTDPDGCMLIAQELRDQFDYLDYIGSDYPSWPSVTWERIIRASWNPAYWTTGRNLRLGSEHQYAYDAFRWVFEQGNSAIPHKIFGHMSSDIGFRAPWWYRVAFFDPNAGWDTYFWCTDIFGSYVNPDSDILTSVTVSNDYAGGWSTGGSLLPISHPDAAYQGHRVNLTDHQRLMIARACVGEFSPGGSGCYETWCALCQCLRDYTDYGRAGKNYDNIGSRWMLSANSSRAARYGSLDAIRSAAPDVIRAINFIFDQGGNCFQGCVHGYADMYDDDIGRSHGYSGSNGMTAGVRYLMSVTDCEGHLSRHDIVGMDHYSGKNNNLYFYVGWTGTIDISRRNEW